MIINKIKQYFVKKWRSLKLKSAKPYDEELTVFIRVSIDNLKEFSKSISLKLSREVKIKKEIIKINIVKKYLLISLWSKFIFVKISLFIKIFLGLLNDKIWLIEYLNKE